jgi:F-type H+-transporting ATPase subunit gamma
MRRSQRGKEEVIMQSLDEIKRRIRSIQTTSKITGAMKLVATAKMKKLMNQFKKINVFCQDFYHIIETLVESEPLDSKNEPKRNL